MRKTGKILTAIATVAASSVAFVPTASAADSPDGCANPQFINSEPIMLYVATSSWRIGTLTQYWGWCSGYARNWAHVHLNDSTSAAGLKVAIQTRDGVLHGERTKSSGERDFTSGPTATINVDTRAWTRGTVINNGTVQTMDRACVTAWS